MVVKRRETLATRKRRAELARNRQGLNGKWESNAKKAKARIVRMSSHRIGEMLEKSKAKKAEQDEKSLLKTKKLAKALKAVPDEATFKSLVAELNTLPVTASALKRTLIPKLLREVSSRFPVAKHEVATIIARWRQVFQEDKQAKALSSSQREVAAPKAKPRPSKKRSVSVESSSSSSSSSASEEKPRTPARSVPAPSAQTPPPRRPISKMLKQKSISSFLAPKAGA